MKHSQPAYDVVVVGAGIVGLATAYAATQRGLKVAVIERHAQCVGASVRNFGFVTVTGQRRGEHWQRARRTRDVWQTIAPQAGIHIVHQGLYVLAQRPLAVAVLEAFMDTEMAEGCELWGSMQAQQRVPQLQAGHAVLYSPHERRVESREAIPQLSRWLAHAQGVDFYWHTAVHSIELPIVHTADGSLVVGDSHVYGAAEHPFASERIDDLIVQELHRVLRVPNATVTHRWTGTYASAHDVVFKTSPSAGVAVGIVTGGTGASTSFAFAEELLALALG